MTHQQSTPHSDTEAHHFTMKEGTAGKGILTRDTRLRTVALLLCAVLAAVVLSGGVLVQRASAANSLFACFTVEGEAIPISLAGLEATNRYGQWVPLSSAKLTQANGCVNYNLWGNYARYNLRVVVAGVTPDQQGLILGVSRYYAPGAYSGRYNLGTWGTTVVHGSRARDWLSRMDDGSSGPSAASLAAAFSNQLGHSLHGNVLCPRSAANDGDCDGVSDNRDIHPNDFRYQ